MVGVLYNICLVITGEHLGLSSFLPPSLVLRNEDHHGNTDEEGHNLLEALLEGGALQQLRDHGHRSNVDEASCRGKKG